MSLISHLAIIMDGNGRWAEGRGLPRWRGHEAGAAAVRRVTESACRHGIPRLTLFAFSSENWKRPAKEVQILFSLFKRYLIEAREELQRHEVRLSIIGRRDRLPGMVRRIMEETEALTLSGSRLHLRLAIDYGSRFEMAGAARELAGRVIRGELLPDQITEEILERSLPASSVPDPDLLIRTAGERRLSNFLLWQAAYAELYFSPRLWPDFGDEDLDAALEDFHLRTRKFGALAQATGTIG
jgi:undecaprenyl diphosphate synthase